MTGYNLRFTFYSIGFTIKNMGRKVTTGRTGQVLHTYCPNELAARVESLIITRAATESQLLNKALEIALPLLESSLPVASAADQAAFNEKRLRRTYKHARPKNNNGKK